MRRLIASEFVSLDSVVEDPHWTFRFGSEEQEQFKFGELSESAALLPGRVTYEGPRHEGLAEYTGMMNGYPKYVVSATLEEADWNKSTIIKENVALEIKGIS